MARAMTEEAKEQKKQFILEEAFKLYEQKSFNEFRMEDLAIICNISKGLLFKYFRTKEILFFHMLDIEYTKMLQATEDAFLAHDSITPTIVKETLIDITRNVFQPDTPLVRLSRLQNIILELNIDYEFAVQHKLTLTEIRNRVISNIVQRLDGITAEQFGKIFSTHTALLYGYLQSCTTSEVMKKVINEYNLKQYDIDPIEETIQSLSIFIDGYLHIK